MKFKKYLDSKNISTDAAARALDTTVVSINRYINGNRIPNQKYMQKIFEYTNGAVTPNDFFNIANDNEPLPPDGVA